MRNKIYVLVIYSFSITLLSHVFSILTDWNVIPWVPLTFWLIIILIIPLWKFLLAKQKETSIYVVAFLAYRFLFFLVIYLFIGSVYPIASKLDLREHFSNYTLIDDREYFDSPDPEYYGDSNGSSGYSSTFNYYVEIETSLLNLKLPEGVIVNDEDGYAIKNKYGDMIHLNISNCTSKDVAYLLGYKSLGKNTKGENSVFLPINFLWYILVKDGLYTMLFIVVIILVLIRKPENLFPIKNNSKEKPLSRLRNMQEPKEALASDAEVKMREITPKERKILLRATFRIEELKEKESQLKKNKISDKLMQEGKDQVSKGLDMFKKASKPSDSN